jgi:hypothetical protein
LTLPAEQIRNEQTTSSTPSAGARAHAWFQFSAFQRFASFHLQPVEQRALGLLLAGSEFDQAPDTVGSAMKPQAGAYSLVSGPYG